MPGIDREVPKWALWLGSLMGVAVMVWLAKDLSANVSEHDRRITTLEAKIDYLVDGQRRMLDAINKPK